MTESVNRGAGTDAFVKENNKAENPMTQARIEKITLNIGSGRDQSKLDKAVMLIEQITGIKPVKTVTNKRVAAWGLRPGLPIGCKLTLRGKQARDVLSRILEAKENKLKQSYFDENGNLSFGLSEYIDIPGVKYDTKIGMMGLQICVTFEKPGFRIKKRKLQKKKIPHKHLIKKEDTINYMKDNFKVQID